MARAPSYDFERRERQKAKAAKKTEKAKAKSERRAGTTDGSPEDAAERPGDSMDSTVDKDPSKGG